MPSVPFNIAHPMCQDDKIYEEVQDYIVLCRWFSVFIFI